MRFWNGYNTIPLFDSKNDKWTEDAKGGQGWQYVEEDGVNVATTSHDWCVRSLTVDLVQKGFSFLSIEYILEFRLKVMGGPPKTNDPWNAGMELYDCNNQFLGSVSAHSPSLLPKRMNYQEFLLATPEWQQITLSVNVK